MATTEFSHTELATPATGLRHYFAAGAVRVAAMWTAVKNRRSVNQLLEWDDRMLSDIGLTQSDVLSALASRLPDDPSYRLRAFSGERQISDRARAHDLNILDI